VSEAKLIKKTTTSNIIATKQEEDYSSSTFFVSWQPPITSNNIYWIILLDLDVLRIEPRCVAKFCGLDLVVVSQSDFQSGK
jgi:hypothetical protein